MIFSFALAFVLSFLCFPQLSFAEKNLTAPSNAFTYNDNTFYKIGEIYSGNGYFNKTNLDELILHCSCGLATSSTDMGELEKRMSNGDTIPAFKMYNYNLGNKELDQDIVVRFGGLDWTPTYVSGTKTGDAILTLWLSSNEQDAFQTRLDSAEGDYYGFVKSPYTNRYGLYSDWSADWSDTRTMQGTWAFYPSNMYGMSYIRSVTLNNGGDVAMYTSSFMEDPGQNPNSVFAPFTMSSDPLSSFIVTPSEVSWQEKQSAAEWGLEEYNSPNDEWNPSTEQGRYYSNADNYVEHRGYDTWKNDKLWLPSITEVGYDDSNQGLWYTTIAQRQNHNAIDQYFAATVGTDRNYNSNTRVHTSSWLRSGDSMRANVACFAGEDGDSWSRFEPEYSLAVRPALHLNLTAAAKAAVDKENLPLLTQMVSHDPSDEDIYVEEHSETSATFHIKSERGFLKLSEYTMKENGGFRKDWTFLLESNLNLTILSYDDEAAKDGKCYLDMGDEQIGIYYAPIEGFSGMFDGQNHVIHYEYGCPGPSDINPYACAALFGSVCDAACFQNLIVEAYADGNIAAGLVGRAENDPAKTSNGWCIFRNVTIIDGGIGAVEYDGSGVLEYSIAAGLLAYSKNCDVQAYNCLVKEYSISANTGRNKIGLAAGILGYVISDYSTQVIVDSCKVMAEIIEGSSFAGGVAAYVEERGYGSVNFSITQTMVFVETLATSGSAIDNGLPQAESPLVCFFCTAYPENNFTLNVSEFLFDGTMYSDLLFGYVDVVNISDSAFYVREDILTDSYKILVQRSYIHKGSNYNEREYAMVPVINASGVFICTNSPGLGVDFFPGLRYIILDPNFDNERWFADPNSNITGRPTQFKEGTLLLRAFFHVGTGAENYFDYYQGGVLEYLRQMVLSHGYDIEYCYPEAQSPWYGN